jgi:hypothetical protein
MPGVGWICAFVMGVSLAALSQAHAETTSDGHAQDAQPKQTLEQKSLDPTSDLKQFRVQNRFVPSTFDADGYANLLTVGFRYPIPELPAVPFRQVWGIDIPIRTAPGGPTGLGDLSLSDVFISAKARLQGGKWWRAGLGPVFVFPTASEDELGTGKWSVGPTVAGIFSAPNWQIAIVIQNAISFAGDSNRPDVNRLTWLPIWVYFLERGWYVGLQGTPKSVNWENDAALTFPVSARIGKIFKPRKRFINLFVEPEYTAVHQETPIPEWSILLGFNFLFP